MTKKQAINYMVSIEGWINFFENNYRKGDYDAIIFEWTCVSDGLNKQGLITNKQINSWKNPSIESLYNRYKNLKIK